MHKNLTLKKGKWIISVLLVFYLLVLIYGVLLKGGEGFVVARYMSKLSLSKRISFIQIVPFKTVIAFFNDDNISFNILVKNILGNILVFCPLGFLLPILSERFR